MINPFRTLVFIALCAACTGWLTGCTVTGKTTQSQRTTIEQLLISQSVQRSLAQAPEGLIPVPPGSGVMLDTSAIAVATGTSSDQKLMQQMVTGWLGYHGYAVQDDERNATHRINVIVGALGTETGGSFFGMPASSSQVIPISLPEMALYKAQYQTGYVRFYMDIFELPSGRLIHSTPTFLAESYYNNHTVLFFISFAQTDIEQPPQLGTFREQRKMENRVE